MELWSTNRAVGTILVQLSVSMQEGFKPSWIIDVLEELGSNQTRCVLKVCFLFY